MLEGSRTNVFVVRAGALHTPPADHRILAGVTRTVVLEVAAAAGIPAHDAAPVPVAALAAADEVFLTGSVAEIWPVATVREHFRGPAPGPVTAAIQDGFAAVVRRETRG